MNKDLTITLLKARAELLESRQKNNSSIVRKIHRRIKILENK